MGATVERRAAIYVRISKDRTNEVSTQIQRETCQRYCTAKSWAIATTQEDRGRSAYKRATGGAGIRRDGLISILDDVEAGLVNVIVVYRLDRISRSVGDFANLWARLERAGCEFVSCSEQFDTSSAMGRAMLQIAMVFAELESAIKSERITGVHELRRAAGAAPTGRRPFGYNVDRSINEDEAQHVRAAAQRVLAGAPLRSIVREWNACGIPTALGGPWSRRGLTFMLRNPHMAGLRRTNRALVPGNWPGILDRADHEALTALLSDPARRTGTNNGRRHLLVGIARCGLCGTPLAIKPNRNGPRYTCMPRRGFDACGRLSIKALIADDVARAAITDRLEQTRGQLEILAEPEGDGTVEELERELEQLAGDYGRGTVTRAEWLAARGGLEERLDEAHRGRARRRVRPRLRPLREGGLASTFETMTLEEMRTVILALVECFEIAAADHRRPPAERIVPLWV